MTKKLGYTVADWYRRT